MTRFGEVILRGDGRLRGKKEHPGFLALHVAVDDHSRMAFTRMLPDQKAETTIGFLHAARVRGYAMIDEVFAPAFDNAWLAVHHDGAVLPADGGRPALTTDSYVVRPLEFPGGDTERLSSVVGSRAQAGGPSS